MELKVTSTVWSQISFFFYIFIFKSRITTLLTRFTEKGTFVEKVTNLGLTTMFSNLENLKWRFNDHASNSDFSCGKKLQIPRGKPQQLCLYYNSIVRLPDQHKTSVPQLKTNIKLFKSMWYNTYKYYMVCIYLHWSTPYAYCKCMFKLNYR